MVSAMKKWKLGIFYFIVFVAGFSLTLLTLGYIQSIRQTTYGHPDSHASDIPKIQKITNSNGYYNIPIAFSKVADPSRLDNILINPNSEVTVKDFTFHLDGAP